MRVSIACLLLALGAAGCGGGPKDQVATAGGTAKPSASATAHGDPVKFAQCMRAHGIDMPDPKTDGNGGVSITVQGGSDKTKVDAATRQCKQYMPSGGETRKVDPKMLDQMRNLAKCMRAHGVPKFPDPNPNGGISIKGGPDLDPMSPTFKAADKACATYHPKGATGGLHVETGK